MSKFEVRVEGARFTGFQRGTYQASMRELASAFDIEYVVGFEKRPLFCGDKVELILEDQIIVNGWVDSTSEEDRESEVRLRVTGRTITSDLVDCTTPRQQWRNQRVSDIVRDLVAPYFIPVRVEADDSERIGSFATQSGEVVGDAIERVVRMRGIYAFALDAGLLLSNAGSVRTQTNLVRGLPPLMRTERTNSWYERYSEYHFRGSMPGRRGRRKKATRANTVLHDTEISRYRPTELSVPTDMPGDLVTRATVMRNRRIGEGERLKLMVAGHLTREGTPWRPNLLVSVANDVVGAGGDYLIDTVRMVFGEREPDQTELEVVRPEAYETGYFPPEKKKARGM